MASAHRPAVCGGGCMFPFLTQTITVLNLVSKSPTGPNVYQRTKIQRVRYAQDPDQLMVYVVFAYSEAEQERAYIEPYEFEELQSKDGHYTFGPEDFIGLGDINDSVPSAAGKSKRKDWRVTGVSLRDSPAGRYLRIEAK